MSPYTAQAALLQNFMLLWSEAVNYNKYMPEDTCPPWPEFHSGRMFKIFLGCKDESENESYWTDRLPSLMWLCADCMWSVDRQIVAGQRWGQYVPSPGKTGVHTAQVTYIGVRVCVSHRTVFHRGACVFPVLKNVFEIQPSETWPSLLKPYSWRTHIHTNRLILCRLY